MNKIYDVIIIGAGPAGMSAALYSSRNGLSTLIIDKLHYGGTLNDTEIIDNYVGSNSYNAREIADKMYEDSIQYGAEYLFFIEVEKLTKENDLYVINDSYKAKSVILATGTEHNKLFEKDYKNVSYCAICDAPFYKDKTVFVVGAGDNAFESALLLSNYAKEVIIIQRNERIRANKSIVDKVKSENNITIKFNTEIHYDKDTELVEELIIDDKEYIDFGIFPCIGAKPNIKYIKSDIDDEENFNIDKGYLLKSNNETNLFLAGDIKRSDFRQVSLAVGDGAEAALRAYNKTS